VLLVRDDAIVLDEGYGLANREAGISCSASTIYGIGSTPIDFTHVGILLLAEEGRLSLDDPITRYFDGVPPDKRGITIEHLMTGASGLRDFHDLPGDRDPDHAWIDRDEAVRRILNHDLLFEPGSGDAHSHSAWGLLAAIIEIASGETYPAFCRARILKPLGMTDTGFYGEPIPAERLAIAYGRRSDGETNAPPWWGPTSWLVMGSGGMTSTTRDMHRFHTGLRAGKVLSEESAARFFGPPGDVLAGGSMYGYEVVYTQGPGTAMYLFSNAGENIDTFRNLSRDLAGLVGEEFRPRFSLGIQMEPQDNGVRLVEVVPGSAAGRDGLRAGDILLSANGRAMSEDPMEALGPSLRTGDAIEFRLRRGGEELTVRVTPNPR
jgi:CubicO group peptidase (beta-lactamase class C family)